MFRQQRRNFGKTFADAPDHAFTPKARGIVIRKFLLMSAVLCFGGCLQNAGAVPPGWKIDNARSAPVYRKFVKRFKEAALFSRTADDGSLSYAFWGQFTRRTGQNYDEDDILGYYLGEIIPCYRKDLVKLDDDERYVIECDQPASGEDGGEMTNRHYVGIYKNIEYSGFIIIGDGVTYKELSDLGADPNTAREKDPDADSRKKKAVTAAPF
ncbi:MAG: hypothetical protein IJ523_08960 [Succinivibrionaceae bacterium]|nr:hypothetical protein [Succinivibrionaceae bacterium]